MEQLAIREKIAQLIAKWKDNVPEKWTNEWYRYRADQSYYRKLKSMLKKTTQAQ